MIRVLKQVNTSIPKKIKRLLTVTSEDAVKESKDNSSSKSDYIKRLENKISYLDSELKSLQMDIISIPNPNIDVDGAEKIKKDVYDTLSSIPRKKAYSLIASQYNMYNISMLRKDKPEYAYAVEDAIKMFKDDIKRTESKGTTQK